MEIIRGLYNLPPDFKHCVLTLGNFDGIHLGHQALIARLKQVSKAKQLPAVVMLFEPQPLEFFSGDNSPSRLTSFQEKYHVLDKLGIDYILAIPFNQTFANMHADAFIEQGLISRLKAQYIVVGDDFRFGAKRQGGAALLKQYAAKGHFELESLPTYIVEAQRVSSTAIRQALSNDDFTLAHMLLGRAYTILGRVIHGNQLARQLGFPTANILLHRKNPALHGVYFVKVQNQCDNQFYHGIANIGIRPTINGKVAVLEVHIFDFNQDIYGQYLAVEFVSKIRNEVKFDSLSALQAQIQQDICIAKQISAKLQITS
ncbi:FMN adenylyltransferase /riboflavin kinase [Orbus hercynius]|uniref:Riboflavin biosynthesis protein n=1 Tax=Orbus hercynius TaxID=593135 RepID=A0A495RHX6_9GAMM|nr:bifunctional riboflavin kinase/FAD synthetase [Orbus hercynius]RKS86864.1 FMN adenylyltransferase /riboflavin kinase [Orbus hercynius]